MEEDSLTGWRKKVFYLGPTAFLEELSIHTGVISGHVTTHPFHVHDHEECHISFSGNLAYLEKESDVENMLSVDKGCFLFTDAAFVPHKTQNKSSLPSYYFHCRWHNKSKGICLNEKKQIQFSYTPSQQPNMDNNQRLCEEIYCGPSRYLKQLKVKFLHLHQDEEFSLHYHSHEVIFILINGIVKINGRTVTAPGFAFMGTRVPHHIINIGSDSAKLYAIEFHQEV